MIFRPAGVKKFGPLPLQHPDARILTNPRMKILQQADGGIYAFAPFCISDRLRHAGNTPDQSLNLQLFFLTHLTFCRPYTL